MQFAQITQIDNGTPMCRSQIDKGTILQRVDLKIHFFVLRFANCTQMCRKRLLQIVQFAQIEQIDKGTILQRVDLKITQIDNGTPMCTFLRFADCTQIENGFFADCTQIEMAFAIVQFAQITQIDNGTPMCRSERHFFVLQIALKLKTSFVNCAICTNYTN